MKRMKQNSRINVGVLTILLSLFMAGSVLPLAAQVSSGSIVGYVYDPSGAFVSNAQITVLDASRSIVRKTKTDATGSYSVAELTPAVYSISASAKGFQDVTQSGVAVTVNGEARTDFHLPIAGSTSTVEVTAVV